MDVFRKAFRSPADALQGTWRRWTAIVALFALHRPGRLKVSPEEFQRLRAELIELCETLAASADDQKREPYYRELEDLVRPFLSPRALSQTDCEILMGLLTRCRRIEQDLGRPRPEWPRVLVIVALGAVLLACGAATGFLLAGLSWGWLRAPIPWSREIYHWLLWSYHRLGMYQRLLGAALIVVVVSIVMVRRASRF
jgi:hypothetical protein